MSKPLVVFQGPIATRSGYGDHSRDLLKSLFDMDKYDVKVVPTKWGNTPQNQINGESEFGKRVLENVVTEMDRQPDIYIQVTVANEFKPIGKYNIGVTAGVETTIAPQEFIQGCNKMDLILVPSNFTKNVLETTGYNQIDKNTQKIVGVLKIEKPIEVLFEGVDLEVYTGKSKDTSLLDNIEEDFAYLFVGHWLDAKLGEDRKDVGMLIKTFCTVFKTVPKKEQPCLILKTSAAGFSITERQKLSDKIKSITENMGDKCPSIYLLFGDLSEVEMNELYNNPKVKSMVMFTKGEGYGRPLAEFATTGKPIMVSKWSGHTDFLPEDHTVYLPGELTDIDESAVNNFLIKESKWFTVNYSVAAQKLFEVYNNYKKYRLESAGLQNNIRTKFSLSKMTDTFKGLLEKYAKVAQKIEMKLPQIENKI